MLTEKIKKLAKNMAPEFVPIRRHLHAHPELSYQEYQTSAYIQKALGDLGIPYRVMAGTGVIGLIEGKHPGSRVVALRADIDALPVTEENNVAYKSVYPGIMHACGHDVHTTCLLGAAKILVQLKDEWEGTVKLIFQPGEEKNPGGASLLIKEGVLNSPAPTSIFGLHVNPQLDRGHLSFRGGKVMASADEIYITVKGKGGHAAAPHLTTDTVLVSAHLIVALQSIISRNRDPFAPSVLSFTSINGGNTTNVIPTEVKLMGTFRAMDETWRYRAHELIRKQTIELVGSMGGEAAIHIDIGYPAVYNDESLHLHAVQLANTFMGSSVVHETEVRMGAEDFGFYSQLIPGCFFRLGTRNEAMGITSGVHTPTFDIDEAAIEIGMGMMAYFGAASSPGKHD